jgi:FIMAH domain-containing protein
MSPKSLRALLLFFFSAAASQGTAEILETDYSNPPYLVGGVDQTLSPGWARDVCGGRQFLDNRTPLFEWTPVFGSEFDEQLVGFAGTVVEEPQYSTGDVWFTHPFGFDWEFKVAPDQSYASLLAPSNGCTDFTAAGDCLNSIADNTIPNARCTEPGKPAMCCSGAGIGTCVSNAGCTGPGTPADCCSGAGIGSCNVDEEYRQAVVRAHGDQLPLPTSPLGVRGVIGFETDQGLVPPDYRALVHKGDRVAMFGRWIADCGHEDFHSEMHPPLLMAFGRQVLGSCQAPGSSAQPVTCSEVISRPYLVSQTFEDGKGVRHHLYNELLKGMAIPDCTPISDIVEEALDESGGCRVDVCDPVFHVCVPTYCAAPALWFHAPCTTRFEAHPGFLPKPFASFQTMSYILRPPVPRQCAAHKLLVSAHFTVRHGVTASIEPFTSDAARVIITMDDGQYTAPPLPPKADMSLSLDDIKHFNDDTADKIVLIRDILLGLSLIDHSALGPLFDLILERGLLTDCYDPSYGTLPGTDSTFPDCAALTPLMAASPVDSQNVVVATPIDQLSGPVSAEDDSDSQKFPVYGSASVEWSQEKFPPVITIVQPAPTQYLHSDVLTLDYSVADSGCGVSSVTPRMDGMTMVHGHGLESGQAINLLTELTTGDHTFTIDAVDNVGGASTESVTFTIIVTPESIKDDVNEFLATGAIRNRGLANSLLAKLNAAARARARGNCKSEDNEYEAFVNELQAQSGNGVDAAAAAIMIADAQYLIAHCP